MRSRALDWSSRRRLRSCRSRSCLGLALLVGGRAGRHVDWPDDPILPVAFMRCLHPLAVKRNLAIDAGARPGIHHVDDLVALDRVVGTEREGLAPVPVNV